MDPISVAGVPGATFETLKELILPKEIVLRELGLCFLDIPKCVFPCTSAEDVLLRKLDQSMKFLRANE